jgi:glycosyltransferase involved in cell wall biosynthesis
MNPYVIITPAYNEMEYIGMTIESVIVQTVKPLLWVIVDDGSTDETARIVQSYVRKNEWIQYVYRQKTPGQTYYASNVYAIIEGLRLTEGLHYEYLAILDADVSLPKNYYEKILEHFRNDEKLGIASGVYVNNVNGRIQKVLNDRRSTPKALMVFRKNCYQGIGGFVPLKYGYEDTCACFMARMKGWKTWSFPDMVAIHNKPIGVGHSKSLLRIRFRLGIGEYFSGSHPLFVVLKSMKRCFREPPFVSGGLARLAGYLYGYFMREKRQVPQELVKYLRKEQILRILTFNRIVTAENDDMRGSHC